MKLCQGLAPSLAALAHTLGIAQVHPQWIIYRPAHAQMTVVGFLTLLVFGVGYQLDL